MIINILRCVLLFFLVSASLNLNAQTKNQENTIDEWELPRTARDFIAFNFPQQKIAQAIRKEEGSKKEFETILDNNIKIEFDNLGYWKEIESNDSVLPIEFIPKKIIEYLNQHFPKERINKIEKELHVYEVELTNGADFEFSLKGRFLKKKN